jgi:predicted transposase YbfD/YdcC
MSSLDSTSILDHFTGISDPRIDRKKLHNLHEMFVIAICAVICGAEDWVSIEEFGCTKQEWFKGFLVLENGIPSHDTFGRVFARIVPEEFEVCFLNWVQAVFRKVGDDIIPIDGKTLRHSYDREDEKAAIHMVSAWSVKNHVVLGQLKVDDKSNEITAIPKLLELLDISGCIVTIDAMGCQTNIAEKIVTGGGDYVLALKGNQGRLHEDVHLWMDDLLEHPEIHSSLEHYETVEKDHGRIEIRKYWLYSKIDELPGRFAWEGIQSIGCVQAKRMIGDSESSETRYYISSLNKVQRFAEAVRSHWAVENSLHWILDVSFNEDQSRIRKDNGAENFSILRRIALNLLKNEESAKVGIKNKRLKAGWDNKYLMKVLLKGF